MTINDFEYIYKEYEKELKAFIYIIARKDMYIAEDILQNTMMSAYKYIHTLKDERKLKPWLYQIARNEARRYYSNIVTNEIPSLDDVKENKNSHHDNLVEPDISVDYISTSEFMRLVDKLSNGEQTVLILVYRYGYKLYEIAEIQNASKNTVKSTHLRAIKKLKKMIEEDQIDERKQQQTHKKI